MGVDDQPTPGQLRFLHGTFWHAELFRHGRERGEGESEVQPDGENAAALWTTTRETRGLTRNQSTATRHSFNYRPPIEYILVCGGLDEVGVKDNDYSELDAGG